MKMPKLRLGLASIACILSGTAAIAQSQICVESSSGQVCTVTQPLIAGAPVSVEMQQLYGLVTVNRSGGTCSGTLLNRFWVLTADHCVSSDGNRGGPEVRPNQVMISATWSDRQVIATRIDRRWHGPGTGRTQDLALIFLGSGDFGRSSGILQLSRSNPQVNTLVTKYGRGFSAYAVAGNPPMPAVQDGRYRQAELTISQATDNSYKLPANSQSQTAVFGDSGGPDIVFEPAFNGPLGAVAPKIIGITSRCGECSFLPGTTGSQWITDVKSSWSEKIYPEVSQIQKVIREGVIPCENVSAACAVIETSSIIGILQ